MAGMKASPPKHALAAERARKIAVLLRKDAERLVALKCCFDTGNTKAVADALGLFEEGTVVTLLRGAALEAMALACAKAWDKAGPDRYTIPSAAALIATPATPEILAFGGSMEALDTFKRLVGEMTEDHARLRLRNLRNFRLAHHIPDKLAKVDQAKIMDLWEIIDETLQTIYWLGCGTGVITVSFDAVASVWNKRCAAYWRRLLKGPNGRQVIKAPPPPEPHPTRTETQT
jgi:hypothetical protein